MGVTSMPLKLSLTFLLLAQLVACDATTASSPPASPPTPMSLSSHEPVRRAHVTVDRRARQPFFDGRWSVVGADPEGLIVELHDADIANLEAAGYRTRVTAADPGAEARARLAEGNYHTYAEVESEVAALADAYPEIAHLYALPLTTTEGRTIHALRITDNPLTDEADEPSVRITGAHHGDEIVGAEIALGLAHFLADGYGTDDEATAIVDSVDTWIIPVVNPDGHVASQRANAAGVDLNRDYGFAWEAWGASRAPFSQPETRAMAEQLFARPFALQLDFHTTALYVNHLWDHSPHPTADDEVVVDWSEDYAAVTDYVVVRGWDWYEVHGSSQDAVYGLGGTLGWTIETPFPVDPTDVVAANVTAVSGLLGRVGEGLHGLVTDTDGGAPVEAFVSFLGAERFAYSSAANGAFHRPAGGSLHALVVSAPGYRRRVVLDAMSDGPAVLVALARTGASWAHRIVTTVSADVRNSYANRSPAAALLGPPDGLSRSIGAGGVVVVDMGADFAAAQARTRLLRVVTNGRGEGYELAVSASPWGPWETLGTAAGDGSFELDIQGARYVLVEDDGDGDSRAPDAGVEIDAIGVDYGTPALAVADWSVQELDGDGDGLLEPGESGRLQIVIANHGSGAATAVSASVDGRASDIDLGTEAAVVGDIPAGGAGAPASWAITVLSAPDEGRTPVAVSLALDGEPHTETAFWLPIPAPATPVTEPGADAGSGHDVQSGDVLDDATKAADATSDTAPTPDTEQDATPPADTTPEDSRAPDVGPDSSPAPDSPGLPDSHNVAPDSFDDASGGDTVGRTTGGGGCAAGGQGGGTAPFPLVLVVLLALVARTVRGSRCLSRGVA